MGNDPVPDLDQSGKRAGGVGIAPLGHPPGKIGEPPRLDAGVGTASDAAVAMELGCDGVLMNTAIAEARDPVRMAGAMKHAVIAGREAYLAGRMAKKRYADPSSPLAGLI